MFQSIDKNLFSSSQLRPLHFFIGMNLITTVNWVFASSGVIPLIMLSRSVPPGPVKLWISAYVKVPGTIGSLKINVNLVNGAKA